MAMTLTTTNKVCMLWRVTAKPVTPVADLATWPKTARHVKKWHLRVTTDLVEEDPEALDLKVGVPLTILGLQSPLGGLGTHNSPDTPQDQAVHPGDQQGLDPSLLLPNEESMKGED